MAHKVVFRPAAAADLVSIYDYIAEKSGFERALGYIGRIEAACMDLASFPERGTRHDDLAPGIRIIGFERSATIAFRVEGKTVRIVRVFYGGRDVENLLKGEQDDEDE